jgi:hypothetical protein
MTDLATPPREWFFRPEPDEPTPLTVTDEGEVYGHVALWDSCHTGHMGACLSPPQNPSGTYPWFNLGVRDTSDGEVECGQVTLDADHALLTLGLTQASDHYANTALAVADVRCSEGDLGPWLSGALRPGVPDAAVRTLKASKISGDWRPTSEGMELIAALAVTAPGFVVPRASLVAAAGEPDVSALVGAGVVQPSPSPRGDAGRRAVNTALTLRVLAARARGTDALLALAHGEQ